MKAFVFCPVCGRPHSEREVPDDVDVEMKGDYRLFGIHYCLDCNRILLDSEYIAVPEITQKPAPEDITRPMTWDRGSRVAFVPRWILETIFEVEVPTSTRLAPALPPTMDVIIQLQQMMELPTADTVRH